MTATKTAPRRAKFIDLPPGQVDADPTYQLRAEFSEEHAQDIAAAIRAGKVVDRVKIVQVGGRNKIVDGFHTHRGHQLAGSKTVPCTVLPGEGHDHALIAAAGANHGHLALRRTNRDKRKAVEAMLAGFPRKSARWVAERCGVADSFVGDVRRAAQVQSDCTSGGTDRREGRDGKLYTVRPPAPVEAAPPDPMDAPIRERLRADDRIRAALDAKGVETVGDVVELLHRNETFGLGSADVQDLRKEFREELAELAPPGPERTGGGRTPPKSGSQTLPKFPFKQFETFFGQMVRFMDAVAVNAGELNGPRHQVIRSILGDLFDTAHDWHTDLMGWQPHGEVPFHWDEFNRLHRLAARYVLRAAAHHPRGEKSPAFTALADAVHALPALYRAVLAEVPRAAQSG